MYRDRYRLAPEPKAVSVWSIGPTETTSDARAPGAQYTPPELMDEFSEYENYDIDDWDGFGALPITSDTVKAARRFATMLAREQLSPDIAPGANGTIGFEWRSLAGPTKLAFVEIGPGSTVTAFRVLQDGRRTDWPVMALRAFDNVLPNLHLPKNEPA